MGPLVLDPPALQAYFQTTGYLWSSLALFEAADLGGCRSFLKSFSGSEATQGDWAIGEDGRKQNAPVRMW